jgi:RimJ/RimL family protein N-acetyltransferase
MIPRIFRKREIKQGKEIIGRINLVLYQRQAIPHLEFELEEQFRNQGIMSKHLANYLKDCKLNNLRLIAIVKKDNEASIKLLKKNKFIKLATFDETFGYVAAYDLTKEINKFKEKCLKNMVGDTQ